MATRSTRLALFGVAALALLGAPVASADAGHGGHGPMVLLEPVTYYVSNFTDVSAISHPLGTVPPGAEAPQAETCLECAGDRELEYFFNTTQGLERDIDIDVATLGIFTFWIRAYEASEGAAVPPLETIVKFDLYTDDGEVFGQAQKSVNVTETTPVEVKASFSPLRASLLGGEKLHWNVRVTNPTPNGAEAYNPFAAPYGVSEDYPFKLTFTKIVPAFGVSLQVHPLGPDTVAELPGAPILFNFSIDNHGTHPSTVTLGVGSLPAGATAIIRNDFDQPVEGPFTIEVGDTLRHSLTVLGLPVGNHTIRMEVSSAKGETGQVLFLAQVVGDDAVVLAPPDGHLPGFEALFAAVGVAASVFLRRRR